MNSRKLTLALTAVAVMATGLSGCFDDDDGDGTTTLKEFAVADINKRTSDTAEPVEINDLALDTSNEDPAQYDKLLQSM